MLVKLKIIRDKHVLELEDNATTNDLFNKIKENFDIPIEHQKLLSGGKRIPKNDSLLSNYIKSNKPVMVMGAKLPTKKKPKKYLQAPVLEELDIDDVISFVFSFFSFDDVLRYSTVCKSWRDIADRGSKYNADRYTLVNGHVFDMFNYIIAFSFKPQDLVNRLSDWFHHLPQNPSFEIFQYAKTRNSLLLYTKIHPSPETFYSEQFGTVNIYFPYFLICLAIPDGTLKWIQPIQSMVENLPVDDGKKILNLEENQEVDQDEPIDEEDEQNDYVIINGSARNIFRPAKFICNDYLGVRRKSWNYTHPDLGKHNNKVYLIFANQCILSFDIDTGSYSGGFAPRPNNVPHIIYGSSVVENNLIIICGSFIYVLNKNTLQIVTRISHIEPITALIAQTDDNHFITATMDAFLVLDNEGQIVQDFFRTAVVYITDNEILLSNGQIFSLVRKDFVRIPGLSSKIKLIYEEHNRVEGVLEYAPYKYTQDNEQDHEERDIEMQNVNEDESEDEDEEEHENEIERRVTNHYSQIILWAIFREYTARYKRQGKVILENMEMIKCWNVPIEIPYSSSNEHTSRRAFICCQSLFVGVFLSPQTNPKDSSMGSCLVICMDRDGERWRSNFDIDWNAFCNNPIVILSEAGRLIFVNICTLDPYHNEHSWIDNSCTVMYELGSGYCCGCIGEGCSIDHIQHNKD